MLSEKRHILTELTAIISAGEKVPQTLDSPNYKAASVESQASIVSTHKDSDDVGLTNGQKLSSPRSAQPDSAKSHSSLDRQQAAQEELRARSNHAVLQNGVASSQSGTPMCTFLIISASV